MNDIKEKIETPEAIALELTRWLFSADRNKQIQALELYAECLDVVCGGKPPAK